MVITGAPIDDRTEMIEQLKEKFQETKKRSERVQVLTVLPKSWSVRKCNRSLVSQSIWHDNQRSW